MSGNWDAPSRGWTKDTQTVAKYEYEEKNKAGKWGPAYTVEKGKRRDGDKAIRQWRRAGHDDIMIAEANGEKVDRKKFRILSIDKSKKLWLYRSKELEAASTGETVYVCEGEKDVETLRLMGLIATTNPGGCGKWNDGFSQQLAGRKKIVLIPDNDDVGRKHMVDVHASLKAIGVDACVIELWRVWTEIGEGQDVTDWLEKGDGTKDKLIALADKAGVPAWVSHIDVDDEKKKQLASENVPEKLKQEIVRLAGLSQLEYMSERAKVAKELKLRVGDLDTIVAKYRPAATDDGDGLQGEEIKFPNLEPWPKTVDGETLLGEIELVFRQHVAMEDFKIKAIALWIIHSHLTDVAEHSARLNLASPMHRCGKSTTLDIIEPMVPRPLTTESITTSAMFRVVQMHKPTLLIDEVDSFLADNEDMRGLINAGHKPNGAVTRTVGDSHEPRTFKVYCPVIVAGIGDRPATIMDRSITINMRRKLATDRVARFVKRKISPSLKVLGQKVARWADDNRDALIDCEPELPDCLGDREQDNWRQLVAIADLLSPKLGGEARSAAIKIHEDNKSEDESAGVKLLADAAAIIKMLDGEPAYIASKVLHTELLKLEDRPWSSWWRGNPITTDKIAKLLKAFNIHPGVHRLERKPAPVQRAYVCKDIIEAAERYVEHPTEIEERLM